MDISELKPNDLKIYRDLEVLEALSLKKAVPILPETVKLWKKYFLLEKIAKKTKLLRISIALLFCSTAIFAGLTIWTFIDTQNQHETNLKVASIGRDVTAHSIYKKREESFNLFFLNALGLSFLFFYKKNFKKRYSQMIFALEKYEREIHFNQNMNDFHKT